MLDQPEPLPRRPHRRRYLARLALWLGLPSLGLRWFGRGAEPTRVVERDGWFLDASDR